MKTKLKRRFLIGLFAVILVVCGVLGILFAIPQFGLAEANSSENIKEPTAVKNTGFTVFGGGDINSSILLSSASVPTVSDTTPPTLSLTKYSSGGSVGKGDITNERVSVSMSDAHPNRIYYKTPSMTSYTSTTENPYVIGTENGTYSVYATDTYGNQSSTYSFVFDDTSPVGKIYSNGVSIGSGAYISDSFCFAATDATSGIKQLYYKTPVSGAYQPYVANTTILPNTGDGWYYFYAVDNAGNATSTFKVFLEAQAPTVNIYRNNSLVYSKTITATENVDTDIYFKRNDKLKITYSSSSGKVTSDYTLNSNITIGSSYTETSYYIGITTAIGKNVNLKYHVVQTEPYIIVDGNTYKSGASLRYGTDKTITFMDDPSIQSSLDTGATFVAEGGVNLTEFIAYNNASTKKLTTANGTETKYTIRMTDRAGNQSNFTIVIDKQAPVGDWFANGVKLADNGYTASSLSFIFSETSANAIYTLNGGSSKSYTSGVGLTAEGTYRLTLTDSVGNRNQYTAHIDKTAPNSGLYSNGSSLSSGSYTKNSFYYSASDSGSGIASLYYKTPSGSAYKTYQNETVISSNSENGWYYFYARDKVGNQTQTVSVYLDSTKPVLGMRGYSTGSTIQSGSSSGERIRINVSDTNFSRLYYKTPSSTNYSNSTSTEYITGTENGWYYFYAEDTVGNRSETLSVYYDSVAPTASVYCNGSKVSNNTYVSNSFSYSATDSGSGVSAMYCKTPVSGVYLPYSAGTVISASSGDGWYYFYSVDGVGNQSEITSVYLETKAPFVSIYRNSEVVFSKLITENISLDTGIYLSANDVIKITCETSSGNVRANYSLNTNLAASSFNGSGKYTIEITSATGLKGGFEFYIVNEKPVIEIDGVKYSDGETISFASDKNVMFICDSVITDFANTGVSVSYDGKTEFLPYEQNKGINLTAESGMEKEFVLRLNDRAGNESTVTIIIDKCAPVGVWETDGNTLPNGGYTNKPLFFNYTEDGVTATYSFNGGEYKPYVSGQALTKDGRYIVILTDTVGNKSTFEAFKNTVAPIGQLYANNKPVNSGTITSSNIFFSWDGDIKVTVNGEPYVKNSVLTEDAVYKFVLTDLANNASEYIIEIDTVAPCYNQEKLENITQLISRWFTVTINDATYSFASFNEALACASEYEFAQNVTELVLNDIADFNQNHLVADNDEVAVGTYWLYKSKANPDTLLYYFNRNSLDEAVAHYAKSYVSGANYFVPDSENDYGVASGSMGDNKYTATDGTVAPLLNGFIFDKVDGCQLYAELVGGEGIQYKIEYGVVFDSQIFVGGLYKFSEYDAAGNEAVFYGFMDKSAPEIKVKAEIVGNDAASDLIVNCGSLESIAAYYYKSFAINEIVDADTWAVLAIENNGKIAYYTYGDELPCLNLGGEYLVTVYDRLGNGYSFTVYIIGNPASIFIENNGDNTAFDLSITLEQKFDTVVSLEIRRNGELLSGITTNELHYVFDRAGVYTIILKDNFGRIIEKEYVFVKALPEGILEGVMDGGKTKTDVTFTYDDTQFFVTVTKEREKLGVVNNGKLTFTANDGNSGNYSIKLIRITDEENFTVYTFIINTLAPDFDLTVTDGSTTNKNVTVSWTADDIVSVTYTLNGNEEVVLENNSVLSVEGVYTLTATNDLGTLSVKTFTIDKTLDYDVLIDNMESAGIDTTNSNVTVVNNEPLYVDVKLNGELYEFEFGQILSGEGVYSFRIYDDYNNTASFTVVIDKSVDVNVTVGNGIISNDDVVITAGEKVNFIATKDGFEYSYILGTAITEEGSYKFTVYDSYGNEKTVAFQIVKGTKTKLDYTLGDNVIIESITLGGEAVSVDGNRLNFTDDGIYSVVCKSEGKEYSFTLALDTTAPTISLNGIEDGGKGNVIVTITDLSEEGTVEVYKDGEKIEYSLGDELKEYGSYEVKVRDELGNERVYSFTLEYQMSGIFIALIVIACIAAVGVTVFFILKKKKIIK